MRIAQMVSGGEINGAVRHCVMLSRALAARGHEVTVFHRPNASTARDLGGDPVRLVPTTFARRPAEFKRISDMLRDLAIDVVHTHMTGASNFGAALRFATGVPTIATAHARSVKLHWMFNDKVIAPSPVTGAFHRRFSLVRRDRLVMVPNFIDADRFGTISEERRRDARARLKIRQDAYVVGSVGVISARKRQSDIVRAAARLRQAGVDCHVVLVGAAEAGEMNEIRGLADEHQLGKHMTLTGARADVADILPAFDVYCASSRLEEMPIAVLEAMAIGLPIVSTNVGGMPLLVTDGEGGYLVPIGSVEFLADGLNGLARSPELRARMGAASANKARAEFSPQALVPRIEAVYARAAAGGRRWSATIATATASRALP